jgi:hypothetical protein
MLLGRVALPFGTSLLCVATMREADAAGSAGSGRGRGSS